MLNKFLRDVINLLLYGGAFIGLCSACITALTFELIADPLDYFPYILLIGVATASLYSAHRVIGLRRLAHIDTYERYSVIRKYKYHIWLYCVVWIVLTIWFFIPLASSKFILWLIPGGLIAVTYVLPFLSGGRRLRDLGWIKIIMIGWSWGWLTAFLPAYYFSDAPIHLAVLMLMERMLFIILLTIPFEIRDMSIDKSVGLLTMPSKFGLKQSVRLGKIFCWITILLAWFFSFHYLDPAYGASITIVCMMSLWILHKSSRIRDDYFFSGVTDGMMIMAVIFYGLFSYLF